MAGGISFLHKDITSSLYIFVKKKPLHAVGGSAGFRVVAGGLAAVQFGEVGG